MLEALDAGRARYNGWGAVRLFNRDRHQGRSALGVPKGDQMGFRMTMLRLFPGPWPYLNPTFGALEVKILIFIVLPSTILNIIVTGLAKLKLS